MALPSGGTLILGENGAGKTSLLEAIYVLSTSRSFRAPRLVDCIARPSKKGPIAAGDGAEAGDGADLGLAADSEVPAAAAGLT
ncbi:MAG: AAA family ATPase, partial [Acidobacteriota bacterium]